MSDLYPLKNECKKEIKKRVISYKNWLFLIIIKQLLLHHIYKLFQQNKMLQEAEFGYLFKKKISIVKY